MYFVQICIFINDSASNVPKGDTIAYYIMAFLLFRAKYFIFSFSHGEGMVPTLWVKLRSNLEEL